jgi:4'-phosphopantetheinyl transferase
MPTVECRFIKDYSLERPVGDHFAMPSGVDLWQMQLPRELELRGNPGYILSEEEWARAGRYHLEKDRRRFIFSRHALRQLISRYLKIRPADIGFDQGLNKKPRILHEGPPFFFNVSHSGERVLIAIAASDIGCDVEKIDESLSWVPLMGPCFSPPEIDFVQRSREPLRHFFVLWTRKEALLKATSKGLDDHLSKWSCLDGIREIPSAMIGSDKNWHVRSFELENLYAGAVAFGEGGSLVRMLDGDHLV